ncbi:MAG: protein kinase, partial [Chlamydiales bacterium]|nr:protein kinase [Chlamydiales bacterium]
QDNKRIFIHLKTHNLEKIGKGAHKHVTYSILYDENTPRLVASAIVEDSKTTQDELALLQKFKGSPCIIEPLFVSTHDKKDGQRMYEIITPLYNKGSLRSLITKNPYTTPLKAKIQIAKDILTGSCALNDKGYISRDTNNGNFFIHEDDEGTFHAVLGDLGGYTGKAKSAIKHKPFGPSSRGAPPDLLKLFFMNQLTEQDLFSHHVFALGRVFYFLHYEKKLPWLDYFEIKYPLVKNIYKDTSDDAIFVELDHLTQEIAIYNQPRLDELSQKFDTLDESERFEFMILNMLSTDAETRKSNAYWLEYMNTYF